MDCEGAGAGRVAKSGLAGDGGVDYRSEEAGFRRRDGHQHFALTARLTHVRRLNSTVENP